MSDTTNTARVVFAHGKESGPWGAKIMHLAGIAESFGFAVDSVDYRGIDDPQVRLERLLALAPSGQPLVLVGSSMGGYVSAMACETLSPDALLLMAPALYLKGYPGDPAGCPADTVVVHGWHDDLVPVASSIAFAQVRASRLHLVDDGHRLISSIEFIGECFESQLKRHISTFR